MLGVLFSTQLEDPILQGIVVLLCLSVPLFVGGNLLGRVHSDKTQRYLLFSGLGALTIGAIIAISGLSERLVDFDYVSQEVGIWSQRLGIGSLLLGLLAVMYSMVRSETIIDQVVDRFRHVADHISEGFMLLDRDGNIILVNRSLLLSIGLHEEELIGQNAREFAAKNGVELSNVLPENSNLESLRTVELVWNQRGVERHYQLTDTAIYDRRRKKEGELLIIRDITQQKQLAERLEVYTQDLHKLVDAQTKEIRDAEERQSDLLMQMDEGFLTTDENYVIDFANVQIARIINLDIEAVKGRNLLDLVSLYDRDRLKNAMSTCTTGEDRSSSQDYDLMREDGAYVPVKMSIAKARGAGKQLDHFSLVVTDMQESMKLQDEIAKHADELEKANEELRELDRAKDTLLSNVSHELRTPLSTIEGYVEMFQTGSLGEVDGPQVGALNVMKRNLDRLSVLIHEMIEFSRMEIRGILLYETVFNLDTFVREPIQSAHPNANHKEIRLRTTTEDTALSIWGDRNKLEQVMGILLSNAIKFSHNEKTIEISVNRAGAHDVEISIRDYGIGIEQKNLDRIFQKFYQVDSTMTRQFEGTGIGLSIASSIIEAHGGKILVESTLNEGATFTLTLPDSVFGWTHIRKEHVSLEHTLIYVVNSNIEFRHACAELLSAMGATVEEFYSAHDTFRQANEEEPDLVLFGETLPDVSGVEAITLFKNTPGTRKIPLMLMVTRSPKKGEKTSLDAEIVIWKPFSSYELVQKVHSRIVRKQTQPEVSR
jgi:PAS domain S-box-containing protein